MDAVFIVLHHFSSFCIIFQAGFIGAIVLPLYQAFAKLEELDLAPCLAQLTKNLDQWKRINSALLAKADEATKKATKICFEVHSGKSLSQSNSSNVANMLTSTHDPYVKLHLGDEMSRTKAVGNTALGTTMFWEEKHSKKLEFNLSEDSATELLLEVSG